MAETPLIEARGVTRELPGPVPVTLVRDIDLAIPRGQFVAITGPSGSGKSSLLYLLGLLDVPTRGEILLEGANTTTLDRARQAQVRLSRLGFVFQFHFLLHEFTVLDNVRVPMRQLGALPNGEIEKRARDLLAMLDMTDYAGRLPEQLSGGQRQRVALARALANEPALILADEPTGNLDSKNAQQVFDIFKRLVEEKGQTVIAVTHELDLAAQAHRRIKLVDGRVVEDSG